MTAIHQTWDDLQQMKGIGLQRPPSIPESWILQAQEHNTTADETTIPVLAMSEQQIAVEMQVVQVCISQPVNHTTLTITSAPVQLIAQPLQAYVPFTLEAILVATDPASGKPTVFAAHFFARDLSNGQKLILGQTQAILTSNLYRFSLGNVTLKPGTYRVQICLMIRGAAGIGYLELPMLRVT